ncbi:TonB-dependent receptor [Kerstersia gyiorum]|uniref:TonB-dependent receptor n=1 Tax=Kerstersia gyiorum TaxID=206506 RepID=UPI00209DA950|nr:hemoglobin/transferrin/lactoferrin receptor protein [Kerstersia gyiorum]MCP1671114.1 hemoglobin/transferrin/lactoferrin receptor protein [Kerstersia gyiorum]MCP1709289.1 hemoglobin/transferrin/lactoferrin receptor protein [Kerstersia gyiorum]
MNKLLIAEQGRPGLRPGPAGHVQADALSRAPAYQAYLQTRHALASRLGHVLLGLSVTALAGGQMDVRAQGMAAAAAAPSHSYAIPADSLSNVLAEFAARAGVALSFDPAMLDGLRSSGLQGEFSVAQGFGRILAGTGFEVERRANGYAVKRSPQASVSELETVIVQGEHRPQDEVYRTAASVSYLSRDDIERFRGTSIGDIFQGTPGVLVGENRNSGGLDVNIRGMQGQSRVPVLVDGARQETTVYRGYSGVSSRSYVDPDLIGGIEISKGPVNGVGGVGATGGVVAMRTINADDIIRDGKDWGIRVRGSTSGNSSAAPAPGTAGGVQNTGKFHDNCAVPSLCGGQFAMPDSHRTESAFDRPALLDPYSYAASIAGAWRTESLDLVAAYSKRRQGTYYAGKHGPTPELTYAKESEPFLDKVTIGYQGATRFYGGEQVINSNSNSDSQLLKGKLRLPADQQVELSYLRYHSEYGELMPSQLLWFDKIRQTSNSEVTAQTATARYEWDPADSSLIHLKTGVWYTHTDSVNRNYSDELGQVVQEKDPEKERYKRFGADLSNESQFTFLGEHRLNYGGSYQREDIGLVKPGVEALYASGRSGYRHETSLFVDWNWQPAPEWNLNAGLRYQRARGHDNKRMVARHTEICTSVGADGRCEGGKISVPPEQCGWTGPCDHPQYYDVRTSGTSPIFSVSWEPWMNGLQFYARHAEAYRMPSLFESTRGWSAAPLQDVALKPEHAINREVGMNLLTEGVLASNDRLAAKLAYFRNHTKNYLTRTFPNTWEDSGEDFVMRNVESVEVRGMEATLDYDAGWVYTRLSGTRYNFVEVCQIGGSNRIHECTDYGLATSYFNDMIPPKWHASLQLGTRLFEGKLDVGARVTLMGKRNQVPRFNNDTARGFVQPVQWHAYQLVDVYASYRFSDAFSVDFNIDNLTDQYYLDPLSLGLVPAPGRTARLGVTMNF